MVTSKYQQVKVIPHTTKMRNKVKMHGNVWFFVRSEGRRAHIETLMGVHLGGKEPYACWVTPEEVSLEWFDDDSEPLEPRD